MEILLITTMSKKLGYYWQITIEDSTAKWRASFRASVQTLVIPSVKLCFRAHVVLFNQA
jgi:hypothetical protein